MKVYYLTSTKLGWDNVINITTSPEKCIEEYTDGEVIPSSPEEAYEYVEKSNHLYIGDMLLKD